MSIFLFKSIFSDIMNKNYWKLECSRMESFSPAKKEILGYYVIHMQISNDIMWNMEDVFTYGVVQHQRFSPKFRKNFSIFKFNINSSKSKINNINRFTGHYLSSAISKHYWH